MLIDILKKGSTSRSITLRIVDASTGAPVTSAVYNSSGIALWYRREGAVKTSITAVTLSALTDAWTSGGFLHVGDGVYRFDIPDAAFASGANYVDIGGTITGMVVIGGRVRLAGADLEDATRFGLSALPNAAAGATGGLPTVDSTNSVKIQTRYKQNQALSNYPFLMTDSTNHNPATGKTVTASRLIDGGTFGAGGLSAVTEIANGMYRVDLAAGDMNGGAITLMFAASGCDTLFVTLFTEP